MSYRFIDPTKIPVEEDCMERGEVFAGESVEGYLLNCFELIEMGNEFEEGVEVGSFENFENSKKLHVGIHVIVGGRLSDETLSALESVIGEVLNRIKGVQYKFRKDNVQLIIDKRYPLSFALECIGRILFSVFKSFDIVERVRVRIITDKAEFEKQLEISKKIHAIREVNLGKRDEEVDEYYLCRSCQHYLPFHVCVITPERPSPCGSLWSEAKASDELKLVQYYKPIKKSELERELKRESDGNIEKVNVHSVLSNPPSTGLYSELIVFYDPTIDGFGIVDRSFKERTPIGLTFYEMEKIIIGRQVKGFVGVSFSYLKSEKFLKEDGGWERVYWVSPRVYEHIKSFLPQKILKRLRTPKP